jgi:hypothetical protein
LKSKGKVQDSEPKQLPMEKVQAMLSRRIKDLGLYMFAANSRTRPHRAEKLFGYKAKHPSLWECIEADVGASVD